MTHKVWVIKIGPKNFSFTTQHSSESGFGWRRKKRKKEKEGTGGAARFFLQLMGTLWKMKLLYVRGPPI